MANNFGLRWEPGEFKLNFNNSLPCIGTLGRCEFEDIAARLIYHSQKAGEWVVMESPGHIPEVLKMIKEGFIQEKVEMPTGKSTYTLTNKALALIHDKFPA